MKYGQKESMTNMDIKYANEHPDEVKKSITPSGYFGDGPENIVQLNNFIKKEELEFLINFARNLKEWDVTRTHYNDDGTIIYESDYWTDRVATSTTLYKVNPEVPSLIDVLNNRLSKVIKSTFKVSAKPVGPAIVKWLPGQFQLPHADKELHEGPDAGKPNDFPHYDIGALYYLNDDYEGGELYFPKQDIEFKPEPGSAYFFPGDMNYIHGVREITSGIRYTCPAFWTITSHEV